MCTALIALIAAPLAAAPIPPADLVVENARIWSDGLTGPATFAAITDGRFVYVGAPDPDFIGPGTERIDARGRLVIPGLIDSHVHMLNGGLGLSQLLLRDAKDKDDFIRKVGEWAKSLPEGKWVLGGRWSTESWATPEQPTKEWVDPVTGSRPLYLPRMDGHSALVNSAALRLAGITKTGPPDPDGGVIDRDPATGEPTGILRESAMGLVSRLIPPPTREEKLAALVRAMREANANGITAVSDIPPFADLPVYEDLAKLEGISVRFFLYPTAEDWTEAARHRFRGKSGWIELKGFKAYMDGSLGSRTAYMRAPFNNNPADQTNWRGLLREGVEDGKIEKNFKAAAAANKQSIAHAIGDEANHMLLDMLSRAYPNLKTARCRSEHTQHLLPNDIARFAQLGVIASMQPYHKADDGRYAESYIGAERCKSSYAFRSLLRAGAIVAFGSDWPVVTINPFLGIEAAVTGKTLDGKYWQTQENLSMAEALRCYTSNGAYAAFAEKEIGRLAEGLRADFVILDVMPNAEPNWPNVKPFAVYVEGKKVYGTD